MAYSDLDDPELREQEPQGPLVDPVNHPFIAMANIIAAQLLEILGPMFWAALIVLFLVAVF